MLARTSVMMLACIDRLNSGSAAGLVVLADTRPPALVELAGQEWTLWAVDATAFQV